MPDPAAPTAHGATVLSVNVGGPRDVVADGGRLVRTSIYKTPVSGPVMVRRHNLDGDRQSDLTVHGGPFKAVYAYPSEHYAFWRTVRAQARVAGWDDALPHGFLGENLTTLGLLESQVFVGDRLVGPDCELAVSEPRYPCHKLAAVMGFAQAVRLMVQSGWCGFYLSVLVPGSVAAGDVFTLVPGPREVGIAELFRARVRT